MVLINKYQCPQFRRYEFRQKVLSRLFSLELLRANYKTITNDGAN